MKILQVISNMKMTLQNKNGYFIKFFNPAIGIISLLFLLFYHAKKYIKSLRLYCFHDVLISMYIVIK